MADEPTAAPTEDPPTPRPRRRGRSSSEEAPKEAPKQRAPRRPTASTAPRADLEARLNEWFAALALPFTLAGDDYCAQVIVQRGPHMATAWADLAKVNPAVARVLNKMMEGGAWGGVIFSTLGVALPIAAHHRLIPGGVDPFAFLLGPIEVPTSPIVPPPPAEEAPAAAPPNGAGGAGEGMFADIPAVQPLPTDGKPVGVVTVANGPSQATLIDS